MKKTCLLLTGLVMSLLTTGTTSATAANVVSHVRMYTIPVWGPPTNSPAYTAWASATVSNIYQTGMSGTNAGSYLATPYFIQGPDKTNSTLWFAVRIAATDPSYTFSPNGLSFAETSSDTNHVFANSFAYNNPAYGYTPEAMGITWGAGGPRSNDTVMTSGFWTTPVNEFIFIGNQSLYFVCANSAQSNSVDAFFNNGATNFTVTGTFMLNDGVNPAVSASKSFYRHSTPAPIMLAIGAANSSTVSVSTTNISANDTWTIQMTPSLRPSMWTDVGTFGGGISSMSWPKGTNSSEFFRGVLQ